MPKLMIQTIVVATFLSIASAANANCTAIAGNWSGTMKSNERSDLNGAVTVKVEKNCRVNWTLPSGDINRCKYKSRKGQTEYSCSLGSRGTVKATKSRIVMQNTYTAARHGAYTVRLAKTK